MRASASWGFGSCDIGESRCTPSRTAYPRVLPCVLPFGLTLVI